MIVKIELSYWAFNYKLDFFNERFITTAWNSFYLAIISAFLCTCLAIIINFSVRYKSNEVLKFLSSFLTVGYAVPGIILAIGVMQLLTFIDLPLPISSDIKFSFSTIPLTRHLSPIPLLQQEYQQHLTLHFYLSKIQVVRNFLTLSIQKLFPPFFEV